MAVKELNVLKSIMIIIIAQMIAAYIIEVFGLFGSEKAEFQWRKLFAVLIVIGGIILFKRE